MSERQGRSRVHGPYKHGNRWRVVVVGADGRPVGNHEDGGGGPRSFATEENARKFIADFHRLAEARTVGEAVSEYLLETKSGKVNTDVTTRYRLEGILRLPEEESRPMRALTASVARQLYARRTEEVAAGTHHSELGYAQRWGAHAVEKGWLRFNPFAEVKPVGEVSCGKPQLRVSEARKYLARVLEEETPEATAVGMALLMGLRAHEVTERIVRDLDDGGRLLWIPKSKTRAGVRQIGVPVVLRARLLTLASGKRPEEPIFPGLTRYGLHYHTVRLAKLAGVPRVTPHGLRGTFATLALTGWDGNNPGPTLTPVQSVTTLARTMGHADGGETARRHYLAPGAEETAGVRRLETILENSFPNPNQEDVN